MKKILIAGTNSGVGKTTISLGIMQALTKRNMKVQPYKVGPDYIDPSYHTFITGRHSRNLDSYMLDDEKIKYVFNDASKDADISVVEGVMGLYDGIGIDLDNCTSSYTSKLLKAPVILVINGKAMAASSAAMVLGYKELDKNVDIKGVIVNNVKTKSHYEIIKKAIETYCNIEVLGYFPPNNEFSLESRHLGLVPSVEIESLKTKFSNLADEIEKYIDIDRIIEISETEEVESEFDIRDFIEKNKLENKTIAIAYDKGFNFYYRENIELLEDLGLNIKYFRKRRKIMKENQANLWTEIVKKLTEMNLTISTMESCTGGGISNEITNISGASSVFREAYVTYSNEAKIKQGVSKDIIEKYTVYSPEVAIEMARAVKQKASSNIGIGVTGQLGRIDPNNPVDKLNVVWYAIINNKNETLVQEVHIADAKREQQKEILLEDIAKNILKCL